MKSFIKKVIRKNILRAAGLLEINEQVEVLYYFLNRLHRVSEIPIATGDLRKLQLCDTVLMKIIDVIFMNNNITYWIMSGNLLGAVRHEGFIPWDDDVDIAIKRRDVEKAVDILKKFLTPHGFFVDEVDYMARIGVGYKTANTGIWIDIFPFDFYYVPEGESKLKELERSIMMYERFFERKGKKMKREDLNVAKHKRVPFLCEEKEANLCSPAIEWTKKCMLQKSSTIFPIKNIKFENVYLAAPQKPKEYMDDFLKADCMEFPKYGILHHSVHNQTPLYDCARMSNTDMEGVEKFLNTVLKLIENEGKHETCSSI